MRAVGEAKALHNTGHVTVEAGGLLGCVTAVCVCSLGRLQFLVAFDAGV